MVKADAVDPQAGQTRGQGVGGVVVREHKSEGEVGGQEAEPFAAAIHKMSVTGSDEAVAVGGRVVQPGDINH